MKIIEITVGNKKYKISCNPGEEHHIIGLSKKLDRKYKNLATNLGDKASDELILIIMGLMQEDEIINNKKNSTNPQTIPKEVIAQLSEKIDRTIVELENLQSS